MVVMVFFLSPRTTDSVGISFHHWVFFWGSDCSRANQSPLQGRLIKCGARHKNLQEHAWKKKDASTFNLGIFQKCSERK